MRPLTPLLLALSLSASAATFHVTPTGSPRGDGSEARPWDLATALAQPKPIQPGDMLVLHAGTYAGTFTSKLTGTAEQPITLRALVGERATIDCQPDPAKPTQPCHFTVQGAHAVYQGFEVTCSSPRRRTTLTGSHPGDINRGGVNVFGSHLKFVNLVVHDTSQGFGFWSNGEGGEIYGCLIYHNGWDAPDRGHGHAIYTQNKTGTKRLVDNILWGQFSYGVHAYGSKAASLVGYHIEGNIAFLNGAPAGDHKGRTPAVLVGGGSPSARITLLDNLVYADQNGTTVRLGYGAVNEDVTLRGNTVVGGVLVDKWKTVTARENTIIGGPRMWEVIRPPVDHGEALGAFTYVRREDAARKLPEPVVFLRPNAYEPGRGHLVVYNWAKRETAPVDLKPLFKPGDKFRIHSAQNPFGDPVLAGSYTGQPIALPLKPTIPPAKVVGLPDYTPPVTEPEFGAYIVTPTR